MTSRINVPSASQRLHAQNAVPPPSAYQPSYQPAGPSHHLRKQSSISGLASTVGIDDSKLDTVRQVTDRIEDVIERFTQPVKPYLPAAARFLIVATFLEDALRIITQFSDQLWYLQTQRKFYWGFSHLFLATNVVVMISCSALVIKRLHPHYAVIGLLGVVISQAFGYGLIFDLSFFLRNLSVMGGLLMVLSEGLASKKGLYIAGLPNISETDRKKYFQLAGRVLLIFLFLGFVFKGNWSLARVLVSLLGLGACVMVVVGFKAKWSATFLVLILSIFNILINNWWSVHPNHPQKDYLRFDFFQTLSIVGGLLLLVNMGPGGISMDEKKKDY
ncbi:surf4-domain-containing protein [Phaffia rhodozyma]|uniref:Surf4-domain-containing protein n=1 Tax=Phaffia rhodozyma TaxID=264483 RepID=A0A0F7SYE4_PHARH|nr:surf4-domain-containing protein [Phaffia rhodozyma]